jgi:hypothetical protein
MKLGVSWRNLVLVTLLASLGTQLATGCSGDDAERKGQLVIAFQTDMTIPDDVDEIRVQVSLQGVVRHDVTYAVGPAPERNPLPATLAVIEGSDPSVPVTVRLIGLSAGKPHVIRKAITTVPTDRIALLQMPVQWLCWGDVTETDLDVFEDACGEKTCVAGECVEPTVDQKSLDTYSASKVFGGAPGPGKPGKCVDVLGCFDQGFETPVSTGPCRVAMPSGASIESLNVGLVLPKDSQGICGPDACIVPLEHDSFLGWQEANGELTLPQSVCDRLGVDIDAVAVTTACVTKTPGVPVCAPWSSVFGDFSFDASAPTELDAGADVSSDGSGVDGDSSTESDVFAIPQSNLLGIECSDDAACGPISCVKTDSLAGGSAGPLGGICSHPCSAGLDICGQVKAGSVCRELSPGEFYCLEGCTAGATGACSSRPDMVCSATTDVGTGTPVHACLPQCFSDATCGAQLPGSFCHQLDGLCKSTSAGTASVGQSCGGDAGAACIDTTCASYPSDDGGIFTNACTSVCPIGDMNACGGTLTTGNACIWPEDPAHLTAGSAGQCMQLCGCSKNPNGCLDFDMLCVSFPAFMDPSMKAALISDGWQGYCGSPVGPNGEFLGGFNPGC